MFLLEMLLSFLNRYIVYIIVMQAESFATLISVIRVGKQNGNIFFFYWYLLARDSSCSIETRNFNRMQFREGEAILILRRRDAYGESYTLSTVANRIPLPTWIWNMKQNRWSLARSTWKYVETSVHLRGATANAPWGPGSDHVWVTSVLFYILRLWNTTISCEHLRDLSTAARNNLSFI